VAVVFARLCIAVVFARRCAAVVFTWHCMGVVFAWRCTAVVLVALHGRCLRAVLRRRRLAQRHAAVVFAWRCVAVSSHRLGVVVVRPSSSCAVARLLSSHPRCCRGFVVCVIVVIITAWSPRGKGTYLPTPPQTAGAVQGRGATAMPLRRHEPCSHANKRGAGHKRGGGGGQRAIGGGGRRRGHVPSCALQTAGAAQGRGVRRQPCPCVTPARTLFVHERGAGRKGGRQRAIRGGGGRGHIPSRAPENGRGCAEEGRRP
jgi:hypothetical protein